jgi:hypothetical protein
MTTSLNGARPSPAQLRNTKAGDPPGRPHRRAEFVTVTPEVAAYWLERNPNNRKVRWAMVEALVKAMQEGRFLFNGDTVRIDWDKNLMDAQHRLWAIVKSGIPQEMLFVYDIDPKAMGTIDQQKNRNVVDILQIRGVEVVNVNNVAAAVRMLTELTEEIGGGLQREQIATYIEDHLKELEGWVSWAQSVSQRSPMVDFNQIGRSRKRAIGASTVLALVVHMVRQGADPASVMQFFDNVASGIDGISPAEVALMTPERIGIIQAARRRMQHGGILNNAGSTAYGRVLAEFRIYVQAYNDYIANRAVTKLQTPKTTYRWLHELPAVDKRSLP